MTEAAKSQGERPDQAAEAEEPARATLPAKIAARAGAVEPMPMQEFLQTLERMAANPQVDVTKLNAIVELQERVMDRRAKSLFDAAFIEMQPKLPVITRDGKIVAESRGQETVRGKWAKWETIDPIIKPILDAHGFALNHRISSAPDGQIRVTAVLRGYGHSDDSCYMDGPADTSGNKGAVQARASTVSYLKRHTACAILNIVTRDEDDDASSAQAMVVGEPITEAQHEELVNLCGAEFCSEKSLCDHLDQTRPRGHPTLAGSLRNLPRSRLEEASNAVRARGQKVREQKKGK